MNLIGRESGAYQAPLLILLLVTAVGCGASEVTADGENVGVVTQALTASGNWGGCVSGGISSFPGVYASNCALLTDGRVLCSGRDSDKWTHWYALTPSADGSYKCGTWGEVGSQHYGRIFNPSFVMRNGKYMSCGGEYSSDAAGNPNPSSAECETFDPKTNTWKTTSSLPSSTAPTAIADTPGSMLPDGRVLIKEYDTLHNYAYDYYSDVWTPVADINTFFRNEGGYILLQDGSVLAGWRKFTRYLPDTDQWVSTADTPGTADGLFVSQPLAAEEEIGPMILLPDGRVLQLGANVKNGLYTPPVTLMGAGSWALAANTPASPGCLLRTGLPCPLNFGDTTATVEPTTGNVLAILSSDSDGFASVPTLGFREYRPASDTWATVPNPPGGLPDKDAARVRMLPLPTGEIMVTGYSNSSVVVWTPTPAINDSWRPTVSDISPVIFGQVRVAGTQLNGLMLGAELGDDAKMAANYPLVSLRTGSSVIYRRTHDFDQMAPRPGVAGSFWFDAPPSNGSATYDVYVSTLGLEATNHPTFTTPYIDMGPALVAALF